MTVAPIQGEHDVDPVALPARGLDAQRYRLLAESANDVVWTMDPRGRITYVSPAVERMRGYTQAEAMAQSLEEIHPPSSRSASTDYYRYVQETLALGGRPQAFHGELEYCCKDGSTFWTQVVACPLLDDDGQLVEVLGVTRDIEARKRAELEIRDANDALELRVRERTREVDELNLQLAKRAQDAEAASRAKDIFLSTVSHELRTPLNAILGFSTLMLDGLLGEIPAEQQRPLSVIQRSGRQLLELVQEILDLSNIEAGTLLVDIKPTPLRDVIRESCESVQVQADARGLELHTAPCDAGLVVNADRARLGQVLRNLLSNAVKFTDQGRIDVTLESGAGMARIVVHDTGIGIPPAEQASVFMPFHRVTQDGAVRPGLGLGLAISRRMVQAMGGQMGFESTPGRGSRFWFTVPLAVSSP